MAYANGRTSSQAFKASCKLVSREKRVCGNGSIYIYIYIYYYIKICHFTTTIIVSYQMINFKWNTKYQLNKIYNENLLLH